MYQAPVHAQISLASRLVLDEVRHGYGGVEIVNGISLAIEPGEILCLLGPSGCGKTTLLRLIAGIERPTSGRILLDSRIVAGPEGFVPPEERNIGLVFQDYALFPHLTNVQNVAFGLRSLVAAEARDEALKALERVRVLEHAQNYPHALSGGEQQRVALARALVPRPSILLMDEPFSGLDSRLRGSVRTETLQVLREVGATCVIVTHDPEEAMLLGDRIALMRKGEFVQVGTPEELYQKPVDVAVARFFCEINEVAGKVSGGRIVTPLGAFPAPGLNDGAQAVAAIRPQGIELAPSGDGVEGQIATRRFLGEADLYEVAVEGLERPLIVRQRPYGGLICGQSARVHIDPAEVLVFASTRP